MLHAACSCVVSVLSSSCTAPGAHKRKERVTWLHNCLQTIELRMHMCGKHVVSITKYGAFRITVKNRVCIAHQKAKVCYAHQNKGVLAHHMHYYIALKLGKHTFIAQVVQCGQEVRCLEVKQEV